MTQQEILDTIRRLKPELEQKYHLSRIALFGSYARNDQSEDSDIDILVDMEAKYGALVEVEKLLEKNLHHKVDLIRLHRFMRERFKNRVMKEAIFV